MFYLTCLFSLYSVSFPTFTESSFRSSEIASYSGTATTDEGFVNPALSTTLEEGDDLLTWETRTLTEEDQVATSSDAPKTGFDFLDNW